MIQRLFTTLLLLLALQGAWGSNFDTLLARLDTALAHKPQAEKDKNRRINFLKQNAATVTADELRLKIYMDIVNEYEVYNFDSAQVYVDKGLALARREDNVYYVQLNTIRKAGLLATSGLYVEAVKTIDAIDEAKLDRRLLFDYYNTLSHIYAYWSDYAGDTSYGPQYRDISTAYLKQARRYLPHDPRLYDYFMGEYANYVLHDAMKARACYLRSLKKNPGQSRFYAMACFALAGNYNAHGDHRRYEEYLIRAAISDAQAVTMENLALQTLAIWLYQQQGKGSLNRAQRYIQQSLADAKAYNSRLRILEISKNMPTIIGQYQGTVERQNENLRIALLAISLLSLTAIVFAFSFLRQNKKLHASQTELRRANDRLEESNKKQENLNARLSVVNDRLRDINRRRESLAKVFIDLCDKYIIRLENYQTLVKRKIKANQVTELLSHISSSRLSKEDATIFYTRLDHAFLNLYPTFVEEFNTLLQDDEQIHLPHSDSLNTELRVFALIRLGVKESSEIANLLFYSPQTIYNYRSSMKLKARDKEHFEDNVRQLCSLTSQTCEEMGQSTKKASPDRKRPGGFET